MDVVEIALYAVLLVQSVQCMALNRRNLCTNPPHEVLQRQYADYVADAAHDESRWSPYVGANRRVMDADDVIAPADQMLYDDVSSSSSLAHGHYERCARNGTHHTHAHAHASSALHRNRAMCDWDYVVTRSVRRFPELIAISVCGDSTSCKCHKVGGVCTASYIYRRVLYRSDDDTNCDEHGYYKYERKWQRVPVACRCQLLSSINPAP